MARYRPDNFLDRLIEAGLEVFGTKGFNQSRMSDVAKLVGVSHGTLYNYVESKEALFGLLAERGADLEPVGLPEDLPIRALQADELARRLHHQAAKTFALPVLEQALGRVQASDSRLELKRILNELWDQTAATRRHADALERSIRELPREVQLVFFTFRRQLFDRYARYCALRMKSGQFARIDSPVVAGRFLIESVTLFARHRHRDPDPKILPDEETIRNSIVDLLINSLVVDQAVAR